MTDEDKKRVDDMYIQNGLEPDPMEDVAASLKGLIAVIVVVTGITLLAFTLWGK